MKRFIWRTSSHSSQTACVEVAIAGEVVAVRDYQSSIRTACDGTTEALTLPKSNVMYFELENKAWVCVRPSGTEPKIKLYVNAVSDNPEKTQQLLTAYADAAVKLLESF